MRNELLDMCSDSAMAILPWDEPIFSDTFEKVWDVVKFITNRTYPLARFRVIVQALLDENYQFTPADGQSFLGFAKCR